MVFFYIDWTCTKKKIRMLNFFAVVPNSCPQVGSGSSTCPLPPPPPRSSELFIADLIPEFQRYIFRSLIWSFRLLHGRKAKKRTPVRGANSEQRKKPVDTRRRRCRIVAAIARTENFFMPVPATRLLFPIRNCFARSPLRLVGSRSMKALTG